MFVTIMVVIISVCWSNKNKTEHQTSHKQNKTCAKKTPKKLVQTKNFFFLHGFIISQQKKHSKSNNKKTRKTPYFYFVSVTNAVVSPVFPTTISPFSVLTHETEIVSPSKHSCKKFISKWLNSLLSMADATKFA